MSWITLGEFELRRVKIRVDFRSTDELAEERSTNSISGPDFSVRYDPRNINSGRLVNISARAIEAQTDVVIWNGLRFTPNLRAFEASLNDLADGNISLLAFRIAVTGIAQTPSVWRSFGIEWAGAAPLSNRIKAQITLKLTAQDSLRLLSIRNEMSALADFAEQKDRVERRISELRRQIERDRELLQSRLRRRLPAEEIAERLSQNNIDLEHQGRLRRFYRERIRTIASRVSALRGRLTTRLGRLAASRIVRSKLVQIGRRLLQRLIPVLNGVAFLNDVYEALNTIRGLLEGTIGFGFEEGAEEEQENPAESIEEGNLDAPDTPAEATSVNAATRGMSETGTESPITENERGLEQTESHPVDSSGSTSNDGNLPSLEQLAEGTSPLEAVANHFVRFLQENESRRLPYFDFEPLGPDVTIAPGMNIEGNLIILHNGNRVAGKVSITVINVVRRNGVRVPTTFSFPAFTAFNERGDLVRVQSGREQFAHGIYRRQSLQQ